MLWLCGSFRQLVDNCQSNELSYRFKVYCNQKMNLFVIGLMTCSSITITFVPHSIETGRREATLPTTMVTYTISHRWQATQTTGHADNTLQGLTVELVCDQHTVYITDPGAESWQRLGRQYGGGAAWRWRSIAGAAPTRVIAALEGAASRRGERHLHLTLSRRLWNTTVILD